MKRIFLFLFVFFTSVNCFADKVRVSSVWNTEKEQSFQIALPIDENLKIALFKRNGYTYFIFDTPNTLDIDDNELDGLPIVQLSHPSSLILRGVFDKKMHPELQLKGNHLYLKMQEGETSNKSLFQLRTDPKGIFLPFKNTKLIDFIDANTQEKLFVFLLPYSPVFVEKMYRTPEMDFLQTYQGIVIYSKTGNLNVLSGKNGFIIEPKNLNSISYDEEDLKNRLDLSIHADLTDDEFKEKVKNLKDFLPYVSDYGKNKIYLEIARLNLSKGFAEHAIEVLSNAKDSSEKTELLFISYIRQGKIEKALSYWGNISNPTTDLILWKNSVDAEILYPLSEYEKMSLTSGLVFPFWYNLALKAIKYRKLDLLHLCLERMEAVKQNVYQRQVYLYLKAKMADLEGSKDLALQLYKNIPFEPSSVFWGNILFDKINLQLHLGDISPKEAVSELEKIRILVASTPLEKELLQKLSQLYYVLNMPAQALRTNRKLLSITKDVSVLRKMMRSFENFFVFQRQPNPFVHVALSSEFKELIPTGIKGLQFKQHLLDDLLHLNLLSEAYNVAMQIVLSTTGKIHQQTAIKAYLIAKLLSDEKKIKESILFLPVNWRELFPSTNNDRLLEAAFQLYK